MPEFILPGNSDERFAALDPFIQGYIEALFFTCEEELGDKGFSDLDPATLGEILTTCEAFQMAAADLLTEAYTRDYDATQAGRDYWFTRNGHGVGYWDRKQLDGALGEALTARAKSFGEVWAYEGDCGKIFIS